MRRPTLLPTGPTQQEPLALVYRVMQSWMAKWQGTCFLEEKSSKESQDLSSAKTVLIPIILAALLYGPLRKVLWNVLLLSEDIYQCSTYPAISPDRRVLFTIDILCLSSYSVPYIRLPEGGEIRADHEISCPGSAVSPGRWNLMAGP